MSYQFNIFTVETKIAQNKNRIQHLRCAQQKIIKNSEQIEVKSLERVNKVALFRVSMQHTSQYTMKLGADYYAKVKDKTALDIIRNRIKQIDSQNVKWEQVKDKLVKQKQKAKNEQTNLQKNQFGSKVQVIGQNQQGEQVFNIVQFQEDYNPKRQQKSILTTIKQKQQQQTEQNIENQKKQKVILEKNIQAQPKYQQIKQTNIQQVKQIKKNEIIQKPKKMSKFKADRLKQKQKQK